MAGGNAVSLHQAQLVHFSLPTLLWLFHCESLEQVASLFIWWDHEQPKLEEKSRLAWKSAIRKQVKGMFGRYVSNRCHWCDCCTGWIILSSQAISNTFSALIAAILWSGLYVPGSIWASVVPEYLHSQQGFPFDLSKQCPVDRSAGLSRYLILVTLGYVFYEILSQLIAYAA